MMHHHFFVVLLPNMGLAGQMGWSSNHQICLAWASSASVGRPSRFLVSLDAVSICLLYIPLSQSSLPGVAQGASLHTILHIVSYCEHCCQSRHAGKCCTLNPVSWYIEKGRGLNAMSCRLCSIEGDIFAVTNKKGEEQHLICYQPPMSATGSTLQFPDPILVNLCLKALSNQVADCKHQMRQASHSKAQSCL